MQPPFVNIANQMTTLQIPAGVDGRMYRAELAIGDQREPALYVYRLSSRGPAILRTIFRLADQSPIGPIDGEVDFVARGPVIAEVTSVVATATLTTITFSATMSCCGIRNNGRRLESFDPGLNMAIPSGAKRWWNLQSGQVVTFLDPFGGAIGPPMARFDGGWLPIPPGAAEVNNTSGVPISMLWSFEL
jgi:hypothetical protein